MRKLVVSEFMTLDGVVESPNRWSLESRSQEQERFKLEELFAADALLLGRVTYEGFAAAWPHLVEQTGDYGRRMNSIAKHVASSTLDQADWNNSSILRHDIPQAISKLKQQPGQDILIFGSIRLVQSLMVHDLIDEYRLMVFPVVVGQGQRLFSENSPKKTLKLLETQTFSSGVVLLRYTPAKEQP